MNELREFIKKHCQQVALGSGDVDIEFFGVKVVDEPSAESLKSLVASNNAGEFGSEVDLFDGQEHNYINLGGWIGDQGYALMLMALGSHLKVWELLTPEKLMPFLDEAMKKQMAGMGMISIVSKNKDNKQEAH